jgi:lauroyl/myristoyl acyltransferase
VAADIRKRRLKQAERPLFTRQDAWFLLELPVLFFVATFVPERRWASVCYRLERLKARIGAFSPRSIERGLALAGTDAVRCREDAFRIAATRSEHHIQIVREFFWGWRTPITLEGADNIRAALAEGRGAVLWVAHFSFNALASKKALHDAGFHVSHLSRPEHGFSKSRFGIAWLNPIRVKAELRYLDGRVIIDRARPTSAVQRGRKLLAENRIISITAGAWEGAQVARVRVGGVALELSTGAPGLAWLTGAALLPVFTIRDEATLQMKVIVGEAIRVDQGAGRDAALLAATQTFADRLRPYAEAHPLQWRDWEKIEKAG